ncbi:uncharacterized protein LOC123895497 isoform X4 [Trifolium pratense]|uniref:uncharacterized protein LOC123895445 isoform X4 n=1 Tax=Trifolium pratense TaxID=57577 RepID=UPI001E69610A|nr:uncharacterized protein LOC123895445 isoform X4 [Trifolium pratense]XP_045801822.1 uncharacterized protein LOC123895497 isoform X4 [Trifolium pratense]
MLFFLSVFFHIQICLCFAARKMVKTHDHNLSNGKRFTNPATTKIDEDLELRYPHKGMFKELLKKQGSQNYGLIVKLGFVLITRKWNIEFQKSIIRDCCS